MKVTAGIFRKIIQYCGCGAVAMLGDRSFYRHLYGVLRHQVRAFYWLFCAVADGRMICFFIYWLKKR